MTYREQDLYKQDEYSTGEYVESPDHIPTTDAVRAIYATDYYMVEVGGRGTVVGRAEAFDRWLDEIETAAFSRGHDAGYEGGYTAGRDF